MPEIQYTATGKRKSSIARVSLTPGAGKIIVNEKPAEEYFGRETLRMILRQPLELTGTIGKYNISVNVNGGGGSGQAGAIRHGISKALLEINPEFRTKLKKEASLPGIREKKKEKNTVRKVPERDSSSRRGNISL